MRLWPVLFVASIALTGCGRPPDANTRQFELQGQILAVRPERHEVVIKHQDIKGFMQGMTMPFTVRDDALMAGKKPGDLVTATLVVGETQAYLSTLTTTGHAELSEAAPPPAPDILEPGQTVKDATLVDQDNTPRQFSTFKGHRLAVTFIYTRCPLPDFCPLMFGSYYSSVLISRSICSFVAIPECFFAMTPSRPMITETGMPKSGPKASCTSSRPLPTSTG